MGMTTRKIRGAQAIRGSTTMRKNKTAGRPLLLCLLVVSVCPAEEKAGGGEPFERIRDYQFGKSNADFAAIHRKFVIGGPEARGNLETKLTETLESPDASLDCKKEVCRLLWQWGTERSVPTLAALLGDAKLSHLARYALHSKPHPTVDKALRQVLGRVSETLKPGIIATMGERRDREAVPLLAELVGSNNLPVAEAAVVALGKMGSSEAAAALSRTDLPASLRQASAVALLRCADRMLAEGNATPAAKIYGDLYRSSTAAQVRIAALGGLVRSQKHRAVPLVLSLLKGSDADLRRAAARLLTKIPGPEATQALAEQAAAMEPADQIVLLGVLVARGDKTGAGALARAAGSDDEAVRIAALRGLGALGDDSHVALLAKAAASEGEVGKTATAALNRLSAEGVDATLSRLIPDADPQTAVVLIRAMVLRQSPGAVPLFLALAKDGAGSVRSEALKALERLAAGKDLPGLVGLFPKMTHDRDIERLESAILKIGKRVRDRKERRECLLSAMAGARPEIRAAIVRLFGLFPGKEELEIVLAAVSDKNEEVQSAAIRALAAWPDASPMETLRELGQNAPQEIQRLLALRGYIRMIGLPSRRSPSEDVEMYRAAMAKAQRPEEKKLILHTLCKSPDLGVLTLIEEYLADDHVRAEARNAYLVVATAAGAVEPPPVEAALRRKMAEIEDQQFHKRAKEVIKWIKQCDGHLTRWMLSGPYTAAPNALFSTPFPPEQKDADSVEWRLINGEAGPFTKFITPGGVNLGAIIGGSNRAAYLRCRVYCPEEREAALELGSDDAIKAWLNGALIHANDARRPVKRADDKVQLKLRKGWNVLLLNVVQMGGEWGACARLTNRDATRMKGLVVRPQ